MTRDEFAAFVFDNPGLSVRALESRCDCHPRMVQRWLVQLGAVEQRGRDPVTDRANVKLYHLTSLPGALTLSQEANIPSAPSEGLWTLPEYLTTAITMKLKCETCGRVRHRCEKVGVGMGEGASVQTTCSRCQRSVVG